MIKEPGLLQEDAIYTVDFITEATQEGKEKKYRLKGEFGRFGVPNKNNRVYTREIYENSINENIDNIKSRGMMGEIDHPPCYINNNFDILCKDGWKNFSNISLENEIATLDKNKNIIFQKINQIINEPYNGKVYNFKGKNIDSTVTPTHRFFLENRYGEIEVVTAKEIFENRKSFNKHKIIKTKNKKILHQLTTESIKKISLNENFLSITEEKYKGNVYCLTTDNGNFYIKDNNKSYWTGNSPKVNLEKVSHVITMLELRENGVLYGEADVLSGPSGKILKSLIDDEVRLGISSRGYGKVLRKGDLLEVAPGYKMITFDIVADPSSQKAFPEPVYEDVEDPNVIPKITVKDVLNEVFNLEEK